MPSRPFAVTLRLIADLSLAAFCLWNLSSIPDRASVPFDCIAGAHGGSEVGALRHPDECGELHTGDALIGWGGLGIGMPQHLELLADRSEIGADISMTFRRDGAIQQTTIRLVPFYTTYRFPIIFALSGLSILAFGIFVLLKRPGDPSALALHWALVSLGTVVMMTQGPIAHEETVSTIRRTLLFLSYNTTAGCFLLFTALFPVRRFTRTVNGVLILFLPFLLLGIILSVLHVQALQTGDAEHYSVFQRWYDLFHLLFAVALVAGLLLLFRGYTAEHVPERRAALRWIFWGILSGAVPFVLLVVLPQLWQPGPLVAEELATLCTVAIPLSLSVAFLRYHMFRIELLRFQRLSTLLIHGLVRAFFLVVALTIVSLLWGPEIFGDDLASALAIGLLTLLLYPVGTWIVQLLEESVFPSRYHPATIIRNASEHFGEAMRPPFVGPLLAEEIQRAIPRLDCSWYEWSGQRLILFPHEDQQTIRDIVLPAELFHLLGDGQELVTAGTYRHPVPTEASEHSEYLASNGVAVLLPLRSGQGELCGALAGKLMPYADPLEQPETDLMHALRDQAAEAYDRLLLQEQVILEQQERQRLEELNRMQSHFVSGVSHDLRTPLTSVSMFLEMLERPDLPDARRREYIDIIREETKRLSRLVENVLDFTRMGRGVREFRMQTIDPAPVILEAGRSMENQFAAVNGTYTISVPSHLPRINADPHALERAIVNVLSNAFKYTTAPKEVALTADAVRETLIITVSDNGVGIPADEIPKIFVPFHRVHDTRTEQTGGAGLGLSLVKHTIESHGGTIDVASEHGRGTTVTIRLPIRSHPTHTGEN